MRPNRDDLWTPLERRYFGSVPAYGQILREAVLDLCLRSFSTVGPPYWFTNHGPVHSDYVFKYALQFASAASDRIRHFSAEEAALLCSACYLHDLAMTYMPSKYELGSRGWNKEIVDAVRHGHVTSGNKSLAENRSALSKLYDAFPEFEPLLPLVCRADGTKAHLNAIAEISSAAANFDIPLADLLGTILLISDELDLGEHRSP